MANNITIEIYVNANTSLKYVTPDKLLVGHTFSNLKLKYTEL